jgi:hypothetical protein
MKKLYCLIGSGCAVLAVCGCKSNHGGTVERYDETTGWEVRQPSGPLPSPTFRPGMTPQDIRDPNRYVYPRTEPRPEPQPPPPSPYSEPPPAP